MDENPYKAPQRQRRQFSLRSLLAAVALSTLPLVVVHYWLNGPEFVRLFLALSGGMLASVTVLALLVIAPYAVAWWWNQRSRQPSFGGLILRVIVVIAVVSALILLLMNREPLGSK